MGVFLRCLGVMVPWCNKQASQNPGGGELCDTGSVSGAFFFLGTAKLSIFRLICLVGFRRPHLCAVGPFLVAPPPPKRKLPNPHGFHMQVSQSTGRANMAPQPRFLVLFFFAMAPQRCLRFERMCRIGLIRPHFCALGPFSVGGPPNCCLTLLVSTSSAPKVPGG